MDNRAIYVSLQLDANTRERAEQVLAELGVSLGDVVTLLMRRVANEGALPFDMKVPNEESLAAIDELESGRAPRFENLDSLMDDLGRDGD